MEKSTIIEELSEAKKKVIYILVILFLATCFALFFDFNLLYANLPAGSTASNLLFNKLRSDLLPTNIELIAINPMDAISAQIEISVFIGILISLPFIIPILASFIFPALYRSEKRFIIKITFPVVLLFSSDPYFHT